MKLGGDFRASRERRHAGGVARGARVRLVPLPAPVDDPRPGRASTGAYDRAGSDKEVSQ